MGGLRADPIPEGRSLVVNTDKGLVVLAGCGHAGVVNVVEHAREILRSPTSYAVVLTLTTQHSVLPPVRERGGHHPAAGVPEPRRRIAPDRTDFPFADVIGMSSYPYLGGYDQPEGGWPSVTTGPVVSSPELQSRYIRRHAAILDQTDAAAVFQITFTDLDLAASPPPPSSVLPLFAHLGLVGAVLLVGDVGY